MKKSTLFIHVPMACSHRMHTGKKGNLPFCNGISGKKEPWFPAVMRLLSMKIIRLRPDFVTLSEVRNYNNTNFTARLTRSLKEKWRNLLFLLYIRYRFT